MRRERHVVTAGTVVSAQGIAPVRRDGDTAELCNVICDADYAEAMCHRVLRFAAGSSLPRVERQADELLYVTEGAGLLQVGDDQHELRAGTGALLLAGERWAVSVQSGGHLRVASVLVPAPPLPAATLLGREAGR